MSIFSSDTWKSFSQRAEKTIGTFPKLTGSCEDVLESMQTMTKMLNNSLKTLWDAKELPPYQQFVLIYFTRNIAYLRSAYLLACGALCGPSRDLQRTIYETILRGYLFIVNKKEADLMYAYIEGTIKPEELEVLQKRDFWPFKYLMNQLYTEETREPHKELYQGLSRFSHPSILAAFKDMKYAKTEVKDCLDVVLSLAYGNIQMMAEGFSDFLDASLKQIIKEALFEIADSQGEIAMFEPDQRRWSSIKLRSGNFMKVLK